MEEFIRGNFLIEFREELNEDLWVVEQIECFHYMSANENKTRTVLSTFLSIFGNSNPNLDELLKVDPDNDYGFNDLLKKWNEEGLLPS